MAEPIGLVAKIQISPKQYNAYVRNVACEPLANALFESLKAGGSDFFIFKYIKKISALYCFVRFNHGSVEALIKGSVMKTIRSIEPFLASTDEGYVIVTQNCLSWATEDFKFFSTVENRKIKTHEITEKAFRDSIEDVKKYYIKVADTDLANALARQVDKTIVKKLRLLEERHRVENLKENLHRATPESPIELFSKYFYDGQSFYYAEFWTVKTAFQDVNIKLLRKTAYGLCDDKSVFVGPIRLFTNPKEFKKHQKGETVYYSDETRVFSEDLRPYPNSKGKTFKLKTDVVGEDKDSIYFVKVQLAKKDVGSYKIYSHGYFDKNMILYSSCVVRSQDKVFDHIDGASFEVLSGTKDILRDFQLRDPTGVFAGCFILHCRDKSGEFIIHNYHIYKTDLEFERISDLKEYIERVRPLILKLAVQ